MPLVKNYKAHKQHFNKRLKYFFPQKLIAFFQLFAHAFTFLKQDKRLVSNLFRLYSSAIFGSIIML